MAENKLTPFANAENANMADEETWQGLEDRERGFKSGVASSRNFNRIFAQGASAGYVLGQFAVDFAGVDATIDAENLYSSYKTALTAWQGTARTLTDNQKQNARANIGAVSSADLSTALSDYLPKSGGTMTGGIYFHDNKANLVVSPDSGDYVGLYLNTKNQDGSDAARLVLRSDFSAKESGDFILQTGGSAKVLLRGSPEGSLTWGGKRVETVDSSGDGWIRYSSGIQMCWGGAEVAAGSAYKTETFGKPFSSKWVRCVASAWATDGATAVTFEPRDTSHIDLYCKRGGGTSYATAVYWLAIGRWK